MEINMKSWEERWAEYLAGLAAAERQRDAEESRDDDVQDLSSCGTFGAAATQRATNKASSTASSTSQRSARSTADQADSLDALRSRMFDGSNEEGVAEHLRAVNVSDEPPPESPGPEPDWRQPSRPQRQPRRPQPPGWEQQQQQREKEYAEREAAAAERRRQQEERDRMREEEQRRQRQQKDEQRRREQQQQQQEQQDRRQYQKPRPASGSTTPQASARARQSPKLGRFFDSFAAFDVAFVEWEAKTASAQVLRLAEVPFPPRKDPAGLVEAGLLRGGDAMRRKTMLRTALLRWHPDKWMAMTSKIDTKEHGELGERLSTITQVLVEQKDMG